MFTLIRYFLKNNCTFQNLKKKRVRRVTLTFSEIFLTCGLIEDSWLLIFAFTFNLLLYHTSCCLQKTTLDTHERMRSRKANNGLVLLGK